MGPHPKSGMLGNRSRPEQNGSRIPLRGLWDQTGVVQYLGRKPGPPLDQFVDDIYCLSGEPGHRRRLVVPPMPSAHLMVNLGEPIRLRDSDPAVPSAVLTDGWFMGIWTRRFEIEYGSAVRVVGVHFKPWGMAPFVKMPAREMRDRWVPVDAVWERSLVRIRDKLAGAISTDATLKLVEDELQHRLGMVSVGGLALVRRTGEDLEASWGAVPVAALAERSGVGGNHLAVQFTSHVGVTPKKLARIYRFARLILSVDAGRPVGWAELAQAVGYFDQPHLINEFKDFTGLTPTSYLALRRRHPAERGFPPDMGPMPVE